MAADLSLAGVRLVIADLASGLPVLRTLSLSTCRRQYPGVATGRTLRSTRPAVSAFPDMAVGSAYTSSFSRLARRSLALRADSDDLARVYRFDLAQDSEMISPTMPI